VIGGGVPEHVTSHFKKNFVIQMKPEIESDVKLSVETEVF